MAQMNAVLCPKCRGGEFVLYRDEKGILHAWCTKCKNDIVITEKK